MLLTVYGHTEKGPRHELNEDVILVGRTVCYSGDAEARMDGPSGGPFEKGLLVAVADGMGSHAVGATAARLMLESLQSTFYGEERPSDLRTLVNVLYGAAMHGNEVVLAHGVSRPETKGMGCTLAGVLLCGGEYVAFHAGDSRVYRLCRGVLRKLTDDDTLVGMAVRNGRMTPREAMASKRRHYVTNATGSRSFRLHVGECQPLGDGDALLLCSDGLHGVVSADRIEGLLAEGRSAEDCCRALVSAAEKRGGYDDVSVIVIRAEA
jgi:protein phosphatase